MVKRLPQVEQGGPGDSIIIRTPLLHFFRFCLLDHTCSSYFQDKCALSDKVMPYLGS